MSNMENKLTAIVIGDTHFKLKDILKGEEFVDKCLKSVLATDPDFIVLLGDILDTHEIVHVQAHQLAYKLIKGLSEIAYVYIIIGNHDYINNTQFMTDAHIFNPYKQWENVKVVDKCIVDEVNGYTFVFCPYVYPGRFEEALSTTIDSGDIWEISCCIFAHQEFRGCKMGPIVSKIGDEWCEDNPPVISGHIHEAQNVGSNIFYPGSAMQHGFGDLSNKYIWKVSFDDEEDMNIEKIDLGMRLKTIEYSDVETLDVSKILASNSKKDVKLSLSGTPEQFKVFRDGKDYVNLKKNGVKFAYKPIVTESDGKINCSRDKINYEDVLETVLKKKPDCVSDAFEKVKTLAA